jgi:hypothetical protein
MPEENEHQEVLTPEQELAAQKLRTSEAVLRRQQLELEAEKLRAETEAFKNGEAVKSAVADAFRAIGKPPHSLDAALKLMTMGEGGIRIESTVDGPEVSINGQRVSWAAAAQFFYAAHPTFFVDDVRALKADEEAKRDEILAKSDFRSPEHKINYISKHGFRQFEELPLTRASILGHRDPRRLSWTEYQQLNSAEKAKVVGEVGESGLLRIMSRRGQ